MILEVALVTVLPGHEDQFVTALKRAADEILPEVDGCLDFKAHGWCVERPNVFMFSIRWETLADHLEGFRGTELFDQWRALIGPHFDGPPAVEHFGA